jgi:hypothetical protein
MRSYSHLLVIFSALIYLVSCQDKLNSEIEASLLGKASEDSCGFVQNSYGARVSWKHNIPVVISVDSQFAAEFYSAAVSAADVWNSSVGKKLLVIEKMPADASPNPAQDMMSGLYWRKSWSKDKSTQQAITTIFFKTNSISEADIKINAENFVFYLENPNSLRDIHMESLLIHEFGHVLGLKHVSVAGSVMWATLPATTQRKIIPESDLQSMKCEYK